MEKVGIIGGIGPESTLDYYKDIIRGYRKKINKDEYPQILINSINMTKMLSFVKNKNYANLIDFLVTEIGYLRNAGADFAVIASNTPHVVFDEVNKLSSIPLVSIVEATAQKAVSLNLKKLLLIGTGFTMKSNFYQDCISKYSISVFVPSNKEQEIIHNIIFPELEEGIVIPEKKSQLINICNKIINKENVDGIILGCTELPLMIKDNDFKITVLNTTKNHVEVIVNKITD